MACFAIGKHDPHVNMRAWRKQVADVTKLFRCTQKKPVEILDTS